MKKGERTAHMCSRLISTTAQRSSSSSHSYPHELHVQIFEWTTMGSLSDDQIERIGSTLMALESRMAELTEHFGLQPEDLNLDLGPLGPLLPRQ